MKDIKIIFSVNLKKWLVDRDKSQADVSRYLGVSSATVSEWCSAKKIPRMDKIQSLANWLNIEVSDLLIDLIHTKKDPRRSESLWG